MEKEIKEVLLDVFNSKSLLSNIGEPHTFIFNNKKDTRCTVVIDPILREIAVSLIITKKQDIKCAIFKYCFEVVNKSVKLIPVLNKNEENIYIKCNFAEELYNKLASVCAFNIKPILSNNPSIYKLNLDISVEHIPENLIRLLGGNINILIVKNKDSDSFYVECELYKVTRRVARIEINNFNI